MDHPALAPLRRAFDEAVRAGHPRPVWWRDDDAVDVTPALDALCRLTAWHGAPLALAAIPAGTTDALLARAAADGIALLQHGVSHTNHQPAGKAAELGDARPLGTIVAECRTARARLEAAPTFLPVMVPPWNRMRPDLPPALAAAGWRGLSLWAGPPIDAPLRRVDTHVDPIAWREGRDLLPAAALVAMTERAAAQPGPIGLLTHHLVHTPAVTAFVSAVAAVVTSHPGAVWISAGDLFGAAR